MPHTNTHRHTNTHTQRDTQTHTHQRSGNKRRELRDQTWDPIQDGEERPPLPKVYLGDLDQMLSSKFCPTL